MNCDFHKAHDLTATMLLNGKGNGKDVVRSFLKLQLKRILGNP